MLTDFALEEILDHLVQRIVGVLPITAAGVTLISAGRDPRYAAASNPAALHFEQLQSELGEGPCVAAYESGEAVAVPDLRAESRFPNFRPRALAAGLSAVFTFPLRHGGAAPFGALDLYRETPGPLDAGAMTAAQTLADVAAAYLLNAQARDDLQASFDRCRESSLRDALTGLPNRILLLERLNHALLRGPRTGSVVAVLFVDLDRFKRVNDIHGHRVGDEMLVAVAARLSGQLRAGDTLARLSGDEFVILCEDLAGAEDVRAISTRIGASFTEPFVVSIGELHATASIGVAFAGRADQIPEDLLHDADMAMYEAKRQGGACHQLVGPGGQHRGAPRATVADEVVVRAVGDSAVDSPEAQLTTERLRVEMVKVQLANLADHDPLTDLLNRRSVEQQLEGHAALCTRYGPEGAFFLVGLEGLEDIAIRLGQHASDEVLVAVAERMVRRLRSTDVAGRWQTNELAILVPKGPSDGVTIVAEAMARIVSEACTPRVPVGSLVASIGVAPLTTTGTSVAELVAGAQRSMVAARSRGGGCVVVGM